MKSPAAQARQRGGLAVPFALMAIGVVSVVAFALDGAFLFARATEMQQVADAAALAAARALNDTSAGIDAATSAAQTVVAGNTYAFGLGVPWDESALRFSSSTEGTGGWLSVSEARASPAGLSYARFDTSKLGGDNGPGKVSYIFAQVFMKGSTASAQVNASAVAGRALINAVPLAICALSNVPAAPRPPANLELVEFGFRRGVGYNLLNLNPNGSTPANFVFDPLGDGNNPSPESHFDSAVLRPFVCTGRMPLRHLGSGSTVAVRSPFPSSLASVFNGRFDVAGNCSTISGAPDANVHEYNGGGIWYMNAINAHQTAQATSGSKLVTIADLADPGTVSADAYGVLWAYAKAAKFAAHPPYANFAKADWSTLYPATPSSPAANSAYHDNNTPYLSIARQSPTHTGVRDRRVLQVALLACPVSGDTATVLGVGRFFMTAKATSTAIYGEFAGAVTDGNLTARAELFR